MNVATTSSAVLAFLVATAAACSSVEPIVECAPVGRAHPICGLRNPEDLALLGDGRTVVVSQYALGTETPEGSLALLDLQTETVAVVYPEAVRSGARVASDSHPGWGDPSCPGPPGRAFSPHGLHLSQRGDGRQQLLVVNHGGRESIELFEVTGAAAGWSVAWRGCIEAPDDAFFNDVASLPDGGLLATHMLSRDHPSWSGIGASLGFDSGWVYEWQPGGGFRSISGTESPLPNGIEVSPSGDSFYVGVHAGSEVRHYDRHSGELLGHASVQSPDNLSWSEDGRLLVASLRGSVLDQLACGRLREGACPLKFGIVALDPSDWSQELLYENQGPPMGGATIAIDIGDGLLMGSFAGDRVLRLPRSTGAPREIGHRSH